MAAVTGFNFAVLAYTSISRAELNDRLERRARVNVLLQAWVDTNGDDPDTTISVGMRWRDCDAAHLHAFRDDWPYRPELPAQVTERLQAELTRSMTGFGQHTPSPSEIGPRHLRVRDLNAHERLKAFGLLGAAPLPPAAICKGIPT